MLSCINNLHARILRDMGIADDSLDRALQEGAEFSFHPPDSRWADPGVFPCLVYTARHRYRRDAEMNEFFKTLLHVKFDLTGPGAIKYAILRGVQLPLTFAPPSPGDSYHDATIHRLDGSSFKISSLEANSKPIAIICGSWSWPPFRHGIDHMHRLYSKYKDKVEFLVIYIAEAHAQDQWPLGRHTFIHKHTSLDHRIDVVKQFQQSTSFQAPLFVDSMGDEFVKVCWILFNDKSGSAGV